MGADRINDGTDANAETVEEKPDQRPPPPPDKPGTDGYPSRADSRIGAAAANETSPPATVEKPESKPEVPRPSARETSGEQDSTAAGGKPESPITTEASEPLHRSDESSGKRHGTEQVPEGQASPPGQEVPTEMDASSAPLDGFKQAEDADLTKSIEGQRQTTDQPQPDTEDLTKDVPSPAVTGVETDDSALPADLTMDRHDVTIEGEEPAGSISDARVDGQRAGQRLDLPDDAEPPRVDLPDTKETTGQDKSLDSRLTIHGKQVNEHLDPLGGADAGSDAIGEPWTDPTSDLPPSGEELVKMDDDDKSRPEKVRKKFFEVVSDAHDITGKAANKGHDIFAHPPTGHAETSTAPEVIPAPHDGVNAGDLATGLFVLGTLFGEGIRRGRKKLKERN